MRLAVVCSLMFLAAACGDDGGGAVEPDDSVETDGAHRVGVRTATLDDGDRARALHVAFFYPAPPATAPEAGLTIDQLAPAAERQRYRTLLDAAPAGCPGDHLSASLDAPVAAGAFPLVVLSHCHECTAFSKATIAIRLASHGFVVAAVEHTGNTLWNQLDDDGVALGTEFLAVRAADVRFVLGAVLAGGAGVPAALREAVDAETIGVAGHSFGAVTAGVVVQEDERVDAAFALAAPMQNPLLPGVTVAGITRPLGFLVATEDNSITELGNQLLRDNFDAAGGPAWKIELTDAGHWSVSDLVGVVPAFLPGCGDGTRQTDGQPFTYPAPAPTRSLAAAYVTAFFKATLLADAGAAAYLAAPRADGAATVASRP